MRQNGLRNGGRDGRPAPAPCPRNEVVRVPVHDAAASQALAGWVGCPHCQSPVNVRLELYRFARDLLERVGLELYERGNHDGLVHAIELTVQDLRLREGIEEENRPGHSEFARAVGACGPASVAAVRRA